MTLVVTVWPERLVQVKVNVVSSARSEEVLVPDEPESAQESRFEPERVHEFCCTCEVLHTRVAGVYCSTMSGPVSVSVASGWKTPTETFLFSAPPGPLHERPYDVFCVGETALDPDVAPPVENPVPMHDVVSPPPPPSPVLHDHARVADCPV